MRTGLAIDFAHEDFDRTVRRLDAHLRFQSFQRIVLPQPAPVAAPAVIEQAPPSVGQAWAHAFANLAYAGALLWQAARLTVQEAPRLARAAVLRASQPGTRLGVFGWAYAITLTALCVWR